MGGAVGGILGGVMVVGSLMLRGGMGSMCFEGMGWGRW